MSGLVIPEILMNIMSCRGFSRSLISTYYLSKLFVIVETEEGGLYNIPIRVKNKINAVNLHN